MRVIIPRKKELRIVREYLRKPKKNEKQTMMVVRVPERLKRDFVGKVHREGKTVQEVVQRFMMGYLLR